MIKLIVSDLDGTLLCDEQKISSEFKEVFQELKEKNILFASASGRQYYNMIEVLEEYKDDMVFIAENGCIMFENEVQKYISNLDRNEANELIEIARGVEGTEIYLCGKESAYIETSEDKYVDIARTYFGRYQIVDDLTKVEDDILKVSIFDYHNDVNKKTDSYFRHLEDRFQLTLGGSMWYDIIPKGANKGEAVKELQKLKNIKSEETMIFGDYMNDYEMMKCGKYNFAMKNAHPDLLKIASFVAEDNNSNGVPRAIRKVIREEM
jgi:Cof subfamily protein (haloacid dehalogenase superfamily)